MEFHLRVSQLIDFALTPPACGCFWSKAIRNGVAVAFTRSIVRRPRAV
jgi:hypothetical protein